VRDVSSGERVNARMVGQGGGQGGGRALGGEVVGGLE
jgi:hypothetical protein